MDKSRQLALEGLLERLEGLHVSAIIRIRAEPRSWKHAARTLWPEPGQGRALEQAWLKKQLARLRTDAEVEITPAGWDRKNAYRLAWPAPLDLFPAEPAEVPAAIPQALPEPPEPEPPVRATLERVPPRATRRCAALIVGLLGDRQKRYTTQQLLDALARVTDQGAGRTTVEATLGWLRDAGVISSAADEHGKGYGLTDWDSGPEDLGLAGNEDEDGTRERVA